MASYAVPRSADQQWPGRKKVLFSDFPMSYRRSCGAGEELEKGTPYQRSYRMDRLHVATTLDRQGGAEQIYPSEMRSETDRCARFEVDRANRD